MNYDLKGRLTSPVFLCWLLFPYYINYASKLYNYVGFPRYQEEYSLEMILNWIKYGAEARHWVALFLYPFVYLIYAMILFHVSVNIESAINEPFKKLQVPIFGGVLTVLILANAFIFKGNSNSEIVMKLAFCWIITGCLLGMKMFGPQARTENR